MSLYNKYKKTVLLAFVFLALMVHGEVNAQTAALKNAMSHFSNGQYSLVIDDLTETLARNDRDVKANYYMGAACACLNQNLNESIRRLKFAQLKGVMGESNFYLARAYQLNYEYELAVQTFDKFLKNAKNQQLIQLAHKYRQECENSVQHASKLYNVRVISKLRVSADSLLFAYKPSREVGQIQRNRDFFESDIDPDGVLFRTERGDAVYFSLPDGSEKQKLYKIERLLDGWGDMTTLAGLESEGNDQMPIMMTDGSTIYFASDRPGGMGGLDIYKSTYDIESRSFTEPVNLGVPFNSPFDDYLFVGDEFRQRAWFASNRETLADSAVMVYEILWDDSVIRNFAQSTDEIRRVAELRPDPSLKKMRDGQPSVKQINTVNGKAAGQTNKFEFVVNDSLTYTQWEHFKSDAAKVKYSKAFSSQVERDSLAAVMTAKRKLFQTITSDDERTQLIGEILKIERSIYSLEDEVKELTAEARLAENQTIASLVEEGKYTSLKATSKAKQKPSFDWGTILRPSDFVLYSPKVFAERQKPEVYSLFSAAERAKLTEADSLLAWADLMLAESQKITEMAEAGEQVVLAGAQELTAQQVDKRSDMLQQAAVALFDESVNAEFAIFDNKSDAVVESDDDIDFTEIIELCNAAHACFEKADESEPATLSDIEKNMALKKRGIASFVDALERFQSHADGSFPLPKRKKLIADDGSVAAAIAKVDNESAKRGDMVFTLESTDIKKIDAETAQSEIKPAEQKPVVAPAPKVADNKSDKVALDYSDATANSEKKPVYRIQFGAFRNKPDASKIKDFSKITKVDVPEKGFAKYYAGEYFSYADANAGLSKVKQTFPEARVVAFYGGKEVRLSEAQKLE